MLTKITFRFLVSKNTGQHTDIIVHTLQSIYFNSSNADKRLRDLLDGKRKEERDCESDCSVDRNGNEDSAG